MQLFKRLLRKYKYKATPSYTKWSKYNQLDIGGVYNSEIEEIAPVGKILAVGDSAREHAILNMPYFLKNIKNIECIGLNLNLEHCGNFGHFTIEHGNAHNLPYDDESFDCVISVMMLEHDPEFWLSLSEMNRVLKNGSPLIIVIPGFLDDSACNFSSRAFHAGNGTVCYESHGDPDCYRFSPHFFKYVAFKGYDNISIVAAKLPPRLIGSGYKNNSAANRSLK